MSPLTTNTQVFVAWPTNFVLKAWATDSDGTIASVKYYIYTNTGFLGNGTLSGTNYQYTWNSVPPGSYGIYASAADNQGGIRLSDLVVFTVKSTNDYPLVSINSPANLTSLKAWSDLTITAGASDASGIGRVDFYAGTNFLGSDTAPSNGTNFTTTVRGLKPGQYVLTAKAVDKSNPAGRNLSAPVTVTVQQSEPSGNGYWDPKFGSWNVNPEFDEESLELDSSGNLYSGSVYLGTGPPLRIMKWAGCTWGQAAYSVGSDFVYALRADGTKLYFGGQFTDIGASYIAQLNGTNISPVGNGLDFSGAPTTSGCSKSDQFLGVRAIQLVDGDLYIGGDFTSAGSPLDTNIQFIATLVGSSTNWSRVGTNTLNGAVRAIAELNNTVYIGGYFTAAGGDNSVQYLARLVNGQWQTVGGGVNGPVRALTVHNGRMFVGGDFTTAGGFTNANSIACWDGITWTTINNGVSGGQIDVAGCELAPTRVDGIAARGNEIYVAGDFTNAWNGATPVSANYVARATWNEGGQSWTWSGLDGGLSWYDGFEDDSGAHGRAIVIREHPTSPGYDVIVAGAFARAGGFPSYDLARWVVGPSECLTNGPIVLVSSPNEGAVITGSTATFSATATPTNTITGVVFFRNGVVLGDGVLSAGVWSYAVSDLSPGPYSITAVATDNQTNSAVSAARNFTVKNMSGPTATNSVFHVISTGTATNLNVLDNVSSSGGKLRIVGVNKWANPFTTLRSGSIRIGYAATNLVYQADPNTYGANSITYDVADSNATNAGNATIIVHALPQLTIATPANGATYTVIPTNLTVTGTSKDYDGSVSNITLYVNGVSNNIVTTTNSFSFNWTGSTAGFYTFVAVARDNEGFTNSSTPVSITLDPVGGTPPIADIISLGNDTTNFTTLTYTNYPVVRDGFVSLQGYARDTNATDIVSYQVVLRRPGDASDFANVTPGTLNYFGFFQATTNVADNNGSLGTLNLSTIPNGIYDLILRVRSNGDEVSDSVRFTLDNQLKIGAFSFSEQDLVIPVNGVPLTVIRTYDSLNPVNADYGYGWTYALNDLDVVIDEYRLTTEAFVSSGDDIYDGTKNMFDLRTGGGHNVALTLPGGQRTTFVFKPRFASDKAYAEWQSAPGVTASLSMLADNVINFFGGLGLQYPFFAAGDSRTPFEAFDIEGYSLALKDGTVYEIHRDPAFSGAPVVAFDYGIGDYRPVTPYSGKPKLTKITQRTGDKIEISPSGILHKDAGGTITHTVLFDRDALNRITGIHDPIGSNSIPVVKYVYNQDTGNLIQVLRLTDRVAGTYVTNRYYYDHPTYLHYITSIENAAGVPITRNQYDSSGRLSGVTDADGNTIQYIHDTANRAEQVVDRLNNTNSFGYDTRGNVIAITNALQQVTRLAYDDNNNKFAETNALQQVSRWLYDTNNFLLQAVDPLNQTNSFSYNTNGQPLTVTDALGRVTTSSYDGTSGLLTGNADSIGLLVTNSYSNGLLQNSKDGLSIKTTYTYDSYGNATNITVTSSGGTLLSKTSALFDSNNNRTNQTIVRTLPSGSTTNQTTSYFYDAQNRLTQTVGPDGATNAVAYDAVGRQSFTIDQLSHTNRYDYDAQGRLLQLTYPDSFTELYAYDAEGRRTNSTDRALRQTRTGYDSLGRAVAVTNAFGTTDQVITRTIFDAAGRVTNSVDGRGTTNAFGYDAADRRTVTTNAWGTPLAQVSTYALDAAGNQTNAIDPLGRTTEFQYDARDRRILTILPAVVAGGVKFTNGVAYDVANRKIGETNAAGVLSVFSYDGIGRLLTVTNGLGSGTATNWATYAYDEAGNLTNQVDALGRATSFGYDSLGRRLWRKLPGSQTTGFTFDAAGNLLALTNADNVVITHQYDLMNRLSKRLQGSTNLETYAYSPSGRVTNRVDSSGTNSWVFDYRDRLKTNSTPVGTLKYTYDSNGNLLSLQSTNSNGVNISYAYDALNRLTNVVDNALTNANKNTGYGFDGAGNLQWVNYRPNNVTNFYQYDTQNRLTNLVWKQTGTTLASFVYTISAVGSRTQLTQSLSTQPITVTWSYDALQRLTSEAVSGGTPNGTLSYTFDLVGNRKTRSAALGLGSQTLNLDQNDWLDGDTNTLNASSYFDAKGNMLTNVWDATTNKYSYNWANQLTTFTNGTNTATLTYDADGNRTKKVVGGTTTWYLVATVNPTGYPQVVEEYSGASPTTLTRRYSYGLDLISQTTGTTNRFFGTDGLGSTRFLLNDAGGLAEHYGYDAYGTIIVSNATPSTIYLFAGEQWDPDLGLYYNRARYFQNGIGRFVTMDSFEGSQSDPLSAHKYLYVRDNAVNLTDPSGLDPDSGSQLITLSGIQGLASQTLGAVSRGYVSAMVRMPQIIDVGSRALFWIEAIGATVGAAAIIAPEVIEAAANVADVVDRNFSGNTLQVSQGWATRGREIEGITGQAIESAGGKFLGGNVKGIDGVMALTKGDILVSIKSHDVAPDRLLPTIQTHLENLSKLDGQDLSGTTFGGSDYLRRAQTATGKIAVIAVPESQAAHIIDPQFISRLRQIAQTTRTIPIIRVVRGWAGTKR